MDLSILIVNWNSKDYLHKCIESVLTWVRNINFEIIVIDSASFDGVDEMLKNCYPQVKFIQSDKNIGFAKANNAAFNVSIGNHILFLNPDTEVIGSAINTLIDHIEILPKAGAIGCKLLNEDKSVQTSCIQSFPTILNQALNSEFLRALFPKSSLWGMAPLFSANNEVLEVDVISGACLMLKRSLFEEVGFFSQDYFMYAEDLDLCYKIKQAGYKNYFIPSATVIHFGGGSTDKKPSNFSVVMMRESIWKFMRKFRGEFYGFAYRVSIVFSAICRLLLLMIQLPLNFLRNRGLSRETSLKKWWAILCWGLGFTDKGVNNP